MKRMTLTLTCDRCGKTAARSLIGLTPIAIRGWIEHDDTATCPACVKETLDA